MRDEILSIRLFVVSKSPALLGFLFQALLIQPLRRHVMLVAGVWSDFTSWMYQVRVIVSRGLSNLSPEEYGIGLIVVIVIGFIMLRGPR